MDAARLQAPDCALKMLQKEKGAKEHRFQTHKTLCENPFQVTYFKIIHVT